ncbi:MAG: ABC transporter ATP-binding protein [Pseudomonadota bacterium]|nr:ABC transporter ATP-binding protein [Pseudomonadota bacterium]
MTLHVRDLRVRYGRRLALQVDSLRLEPGVLTALIGPNAAGKSTLMRAVAGLQEASGAVRLGRHGDMDRRTRTENIAYMPQDTGARSALSALEVVLLGKVGRLGLRLPADDIAAAARLLDELGLGAVADRPLDSLSGGQRQLVFLAQTLQRRPRVLLLDEPTAALDLHHQLAALGRLVDLAAREQLVLLVTLHDLNLAARFAERVLCLAAGRICADGPPVEVLTPDRLRTIYDVEAEIGTGRDGRPTVTPLAPASPALAGEVVSR